VTEIEALSATEQGELKADLRSGKYVMMHDYFNERKTKKEGDTPIFSV